MRWQQRAERRAGGFRKLGEPATGANQHVGGKRARTTGIGNDGEMWAVRAWLFGQHFGHVEQFLDGIDAQDSNPTESGVEHGIAASERAGVRRGGFGGSF